LLEISWCQKGGVGVRKEELVSERRRWCQKGVQNGAVVRKGFVVRKELLPDRRSCQTGGVVVEVL